jgi:glucose/arabinose dehydrogenase
MKNIYAAFFATLFFIFCLNLGHNLHAQPLVNFTPVVTGLSSPTDLIASPIGRNDWYVVQRGSGNTGTIRIIKNGTLETTPFLTVTNMACCGERGLLSMVFHPNFTTNGTFFVYYTAVGSGDLTIARYTVDNLSEPYIAVPSSRQIILSIPHPTFSNHNGGKILFGPDGYLYLGTGDGGGGNDPNANAQNPTSLLGKLLRIAPRDTATVEPFYTIPSDNPYASSSDGVRDEIYSFGLRNPWRWSFDRLTGNAWIADVGQASWEEINNMTPVALNGANFGWRCFEGRVTNTASGVQPCSLYNGQVNTEPVFVYGHNSTTGGFSVTGGYVYRGNAYPALQGKYMMADFVTPAIWLVDANGIEPATRQGTAIPQGISGFAENSNGELYAISLSQGTVYAISAESPLPVNLLEFSGRINGNQHLLQWKTARDKTGDAYIVERQLPNENRFSSIATLSARGGNSPTYQFTTMSVQTGNTLYRLKITGSNGAVKYSSQLALGNGTNTGLKPLVARINGGQLNLLIQQQARNLRVINSLGSVLYQKALQGQTGNFTIPLGTQRRQMLWVQLELSDGTPISEKVWMP